MAIALLFFSLLMWAWLWPRRDRERFQWQPRPALRVGLLDLATFLVILMMADGLAITWAGPHLDNAAKQLSDPDFSRKVGVTRFCGFLVWLVAAGLIRRQHFIELFRFYIKSLPRDLVTGLTWFLLLIPPVLIVQWLMVQWIPYQHPTAQSLKDQSDWGVILPQIWLTVGLAPLLEEVFFRGLIYGWLVRLFESQTAIGELVWEPHQPQSTDWNHTPRKSGWISWAAILLSAVIFAAVHVGNGPDGAWFGPDLLPLFLLAVGLAWVTRRSGRITAAILIHMLLNGFSLAMLFVAKPT